jgi:pyruvate formate lyase activating enzyme
MLGRDIEALCSQEEVMTFLEKRKNILEGVCITGGEPTLQPDLEDFIRFVRSLGLAVKLDTNGYQPNVLINLCEKGLLDYVAMDIKAGKSHYAHVSGRTGLNLERIDQSIRFLLNGSVPFEFRTTVVKGLHDKSDFEEIGPWIQGCGQYFLQSYQESGQVLSPDSCKSFSREEMEEFARIVSPYAGIVRLRGID